MPQATAAKTAEPVCIKFQSYNQTLYNYCKALPKIELHAHLHGSVRETTLLHLLETQNTLDDDTRRLLLKNEERNLEDCFRMFKALHRAVQSEAALRRIVKECLDDFDAENCVYLELRSTPRRLSADDVDERGYVRIVLDEIEEWRSKHSATRMSDDDVMDVRLLLSIDRSGTMEDGMRTVEMAHQYWWRAKESSDGDNSDPIVVGIDLGGNPTVGTGEFVSRFQPCLQRARELGMPVSVHTAEVWHEQELCDILKFWPDRIGHLVCISNDLLQKHFLNKYDVSSSPQSSMPTIEICLTSNSKTRPELYDCHSLEKADNCPDGCALSKSEWPCDASFLPICLCGFRQHPLAELIRTSYPICLCTDDRGVFQNTLSDEYFKAAQAFHLSLDDLCDLAFRAIPGIFGRSPGLRERIKGRMDRHIAKLEDDKTQ